MRQTDSKIWHRVTDLMRSACMLLLLAWTLTAVVSCSGGGDDIGTPEVPYPTPDPTPDPTPKPSPDDPGVNLPILFSASEQQEETTRADVPLEETFKSFIVYGFKNKTEDTYQTVFPGYVVRWTANSANTTNTNSDGWEYVNQQAPGDEEQTIKYWDWSSQAYRFFGVAGTSSTNEVREEEVTVGTTKMFKVTYTADAYNEGDTPYYSHLWYSTGELSAYSDRQFGQPVKLEFIKPLAKVRFKFIFENPEDAPRTTLTDKFFRPSDGNTIKMTGDVSVSYPLTGTSLTETFAATAEAGGRSYLDLDYYTDADIGTEMRTVGEEQVEVVIAPYLNANVSKTDKVYTVLPVSDQGAYTLTVSVNGEPKTTYVPAEYMVWKPGYLYTYIFKIHVDFGVEISSVQSAFTEWVNHESPHTVHNW